MRSNDNSKAAGKSLFRASALVALCFAFALGSAMTDTEGGGPTGEQERARGHVWHRHEGRFGPAASVGWLRPLPVSDEALRAAGVRRLEGRHLTLFTDLAPDPAVDELPHVFDLAVPQWCAYFGVEPSRAANWKMWGYLIEDRELFQRLGLMPPDGRDFQNGYCRGLLLWLVEQPSDYYRRHLLLHEGTHAFMTNMLGDFGPAWYAEGLAELLGTHRWEQGQLTLNVMPASRGEVPMWGRIRIVRQACDRGEAKSLDEVLAFGSQTPYSTIPYAWSWALVSLLDRHPDFRTRFHALAEHAADLRFSERFRSLFADDWMELQAAWAVFVHELEYGYDVAANTAAYQTPGASIDEPVDVRVRADRGWQNAGIRVEAGQTYRITANGRFQLDTEPRIWWSEANGVTLRYYDGRPLGRLVAAIHDAGSVVSANVGAESHGLLAPMDVGAGCRWSPRRGGTLFFKLNDSGAERNDNDGGVTVEITPGAAVDDAGVADN